jgi:hypothetical protein
MEVAMLMRDTATAAGAALYNDPIALEMNSETYEVTKKLYPAIVWIYFGNLWKLAPGWEQVQPQLDSKSLFNPRSSDFIVSLAQVALGGGTLQQAIEGFLAPILEFGQRVYALSELYASGDERGAVTVLFDGDSTSDEQQQAYKRILKSYVLIAASSSS